MRCFFASLLLVTLFSCQEMAKYDAMSSIKKDIDILAADSLMGREVGTEGERMAADYLVKRMQEIGLQQAGTEGFEQKFFVKKSTNPHEKPEVSDQADSAGTTGYNILGMIDNPSDEIVVVVAHYDHLGFGGMSSMARGSEEVHNGADDNASGTAGLLHLAQVLKGKDLNRDLLFIAVSGEEQGLWGSNYYTKYPTVDLGKVNFMVNMDMIGRLDEERGLAVYGTGTAPNWDDLLTEINTDSIKMVRKPSGKGPSDHTSFYLKDIPVLHFFTGQHEDYHKPSDDSDKINHEGIITVTDMIVDIIVSLDQTEKLAFQKTKDESTSAPRFTVSLGVMPDYLFDGTGMKISDVTEGKPAAGAGIIKNDIVVQLGDSTINDMMSYMRALSAFQKGDQTKVKVRRGEETLWFAISF